MEITNNYMNYDDIESQEQVVPTEAMLMMVIDGKDFAVRFDSVVQIAQLGEIFPVPEFPDFVLGYTKIGEDTVPVIDLRKRFGFGERPDGERSCIVVVKDEYIKQGLVVDAVRQLRQTEVSKIMPAPRLGDEAYTKYITGMFKRKSGSICYIIDPGLMYTLSAGTMRYAKKYRLKKKSSAKAAESIEDK